MIIILNSKIISMNDPEKRFSFFAVHLNAEWIRCLKTTTKQIINNFNKKQLNDIFYHYGK